MNREALLHVYESPAWPRPLRPNRAMTIILAGAAVLFGVLGIMFPSAIPALAAAWMAAAVIIAVVASVLGLRSRSDRVSAWDVAGAVMFVGCAAAAVASAEGLL